MALTIPLTPAEGRPTILKPVTRIPNVRQWQETLAFYESEVLFYKQLLNVGLHNCSPLQKTVVLSLLSDFNHLDLVILPDLKAEIDEFAGAGQDAGAMTTAFEKRLAQAANQLKELKTKVFPLLRQLQKITIW